MLAIERRNQILEKLQQEKRVVVSELSRLYQVSEETIRRDLEKLENDGLVIKSYGGAVLNEHSIFDLPFNIRKNQMVVEKQQMAAIIADMVRDGEAVMLDASSTAVYVARKLKEKNGRRKSWQRKPEATGCSVPGARWSCWYSRRWCWSGLSSLCRCWRTIPGFGICWK